MADLDDVVRAGALDAMLTVREASQTLRVSEQTIWRRIRSGELHAVRLGGSAGAAVRVPVAAVRELVREYAKEAE